MDIGFEVCGQRYQSSLSNPIDLSTGVSFWKTPDVDAFHLPGTGIEPVRAGAFVGDTTEGGSVNCFTLAFNPHGNGTHTECVGHVVHERVSVASCHDGRLLTATLISVAVQSSPMIGEHYDGLEEQGDEIISAASIEAALSSNPIPDGFNDALIIRVLRTGRERDSLTFSGTNPPYFTREAIARCLTFLSDGAGHLLVNLPSIDKELCGGDTPNHRAFWGLPSKSRKRGDGADGGRTISELLAIPTTLPDGPYLLDLQIAPFDTDAAPSRPLVYAVQGSVQRAGQ